MGKVGSRLVQPDAQLTPRARVLAVGMLPPPIGGQAVMFEHAVRSIAARADVDTVNTQVQNNIGDSGALSLGKLIRFAAVLVRRVLPLVMNETYDVLYYCPAGPNRIALLKDIALLSVIRRKASRVIFHFHATGSGEYIERQSPSIRWFADKFLFRPDVAVRCADVLPDDAVAYKAREDRIVMNGIADPLLPYLGRERPASDIAKITYIGALVEDKGILDLVDIAAHLAQAGCRFELHVVGEGVASDVARFDDLARKRGVADYIKRRGVLTGAPKYDLLFETTVFVFPSFFRAETQPLAVIEAHAMGVPAVGYDWRGVATIIEEGATGYVVPTRDTARFAAAVKSLLEGDVARQMGDRARSRYEKQFTLDRFVEELSELILGKDSGDARIMKSETHN
ncbi:MAG TPA: glycosyltransferase family 4 protein [Longimicrobiales bacterium]